MNKCWSKLINWEEIWNFTPINQLLRPDYLGVGTTGEESGGEGGGQTMYICFQKKNKYIYKNTQVELVD